MLIDTHAHLDYPDFEEGFDEMLRRSLEAGVTRILTIGTGLESSRRALQLADHYACIRAVVGVHPGNVTETPEHFINELRELASHPQVAAIGEIGLDYHRLPGADERTRANEIVGGLLLSSTTEELEANIHDGAIKSRQAVVFQLQLDLAVELGLNVVVHQRDSWDDTIKLLGPYTGKLRAVFHCFGGAPEQAAELAKMGHLVSFTGIITFKNAELVRETAAAVSDDGFMVETDCPYLAPDPHRGKRCEPAYTRLVAEKIAEIRGVSLERIAELTSRTAQGFFRME